MIVNTAEENTCTIEEDRLTGIGCLEECLGSVFWWKCISEMPTLLSLIAQYIRPGSIVYSDKWSSYNQLFASTCKISPPI